MGQAVCGVRRERNRPFCRYGVDGEIDGTDQAAMGCWEDFVTGLDLSEVVSLVGFANQRVTCLRNRFHFVVAWLDVDSIFAQNFYKNLELSADYADYADGKDLLSLFTFDCLSA